MYVQNGTAQDAQRQEHALGRSCAAPMVVDIGPEIIQLRQCSMARSADSVHDKVGLSVMSRQSFEYKLKSTDLQTWLQEYQ